MQWEGLWDPVINLEVGLGEASNAGVRVVGGA